MRSSRCLTSLSQELLAFLESPFALDTRTLAAPESYAYGALTDCFRNQASGVAPRFAAMPLKRQTVGHAATGSGKIVLEVSGAGASRSHTGVSSSTACRRRFKNSTQKARKLLQSLWHFPTELH